MDMRKIPSPAPVAPRHLNQSGMPGRSSPLPSSSANSEPYSEFKVRVPRNLAKKYNIMRFQSGMKPDLSSVTKVTMGRATMGSEDKEEEAMPKSGAGSEYGRERREEARKRRRGYAKRPVNPDAAPWNLKVGGRGGKRFSGRKEAGIDDNSNYYILTQCPDGAFEAVPVTTWYNFTPNISYRTLTSDEAEEEFLRRDRTVNFFSLMVKKRLQNEEGEAQEKEKGSQVSKNMKIYDDDDLNLSMSDDDDDDDDGDEQGKNKKKEPSGTKQKGKSKPKSKGKAKQGTDEESGASSEEDGYLDSKEVDYMSDTSSSSEEDVKADTVKPDTKDDLNVATSESESEEDDDLTNAGKDIKKMLQKDQGEGGSSEEEDEDPDNDDVKGSSALFLQDKKKGKKKTGSRSSTSSSSRSSTPTAGMENQATSTVTAAAKKLEGRPGTPTGKGRKRPASEIPKTETKNSDGSTAKKARLSPGLNSRSGSNTPTTGDNGNAITEESVRRYLARKPMTTKDLLQKFKTKKTGLTNKQTVKLIATILKNIQPDQKTIKGKLYLSLKAT